MTCLKVWQDLRKYSNEQIKGKGVIPLELSKKAISLEKVHFSANRALTGWVRFLWSH